MFLSAKYLNTSYGIDEEIARFFVDREPPENNLYWQGKLLYLRPSPGYLFIPLIVDLLFKLGIEKQQLLSEEFVTTMEQIGHISALEETNQVTTAEAIVMCRDVVKDSCRNEEWFTNVNDYLVNKAENFFIRLATPFKALHRGDVFLYLVCKLTFPVELKEKIAEHWFALISTLLMLDDAEDIKIDEESGAENAFLESGLTTEGVDRIVELLRKNLLTITSINPLMAIELDEQFIAMMKKPHIIQLLHLLK